MPEYLKLRFDERVRCFNSLTFAVMTVFASGIRLMPWQSFCTFCLAGTTI